jgi:hypothetical protein
MPRKKKSAPIYRLEVNAPVNGRVGKATVHVYDGDRLCHSDRADLTQATERQKLVKRMAAALKIRGVAKLQADLDAAWHAKVDEQRRMREQAAVGV